MNRLIIERSQPDRLHSLYTLNYCTTGHRLTIIPLCLRRSGRFDRRAGTQFLWSAAKVSETECSDRMTDLHLAFYGLRKSPESD